MPRAKEPPRIKGPYVERGGTRFRIRICEPTGPQDHVRENPFANVQPVGRPSRGKKQLRFEEADRQSRRWLDKGHRGQCGGPGPALAQASAPGWRRGAGPL